MSEHRLQLSGLGLLSLGWPGQLPLVLQGWGLGFPRMSTSVPSFKTKKEGGKEGGWKGDSAKMPQVNEVKSPGSPVKAVVRAPRFVADALAAVPPWHRDGLPSIGTVSSRRQQAFLAPWMWHFHGYIPGLAGSVPAAAQVGSALRGPCVELKAAPCEF